MLVEHSHASRMLIPSRIPHCPIIHCKKKRDKQDLLYEVHITRRSSNRREQEQFELPASVWFRLKWIKKKIACIYVANRPSFHNVAAQDFASRGCKTVERP